MEVMFLVPSLISPECPTKLIPALCKLIERNTLLTYSSILRQAAILRFVGPHRGLLTDADHTIERMQELINLVEGRGRDEDAPPPQPRPGRTGGSSTDAEKWSGKPETQGRDARETPRGISFYSTISLEPTYLEIPLKGRPSPGSTEETTRVVRVGMKCIPYKIEGITDILDAMSKSKNRSYTSTIISRKVKRFKKFFQGPGRTPEEMQDEILNIMPTSRELANPKFVSRLMGTNAPVYWGFLTVLAAHDFADKDLKQALWEYREMVNGGWGDIIVVDDIKETISFCTQRTLSCYQMNLDYLKELLNLDNVIDADLFKKASSSGPLFPGKRVPVSAVFESSCIPCQKDGIEDYIKELINRGK